MFRITTKMLLLLIYLRNTKREDWLPPTKNRVNFKEILLWRDIREFKAKDFKQTTLKVKNNLSTIVQVINFSGVISKRYSWTFRHVGGFPFFANFINKHFRPHSPCQDNKFRDNFLQKLKITKLPVSDIWKSMIIIS